MILDKSRVFFQDAFVAYSLGEQGWLQNQLLPAIEQAGLRVFVDHRELFDTVENTNLILQSRALVLILSEHTSPSKYANIETLLARLAKHEHQPITVIVQIGSGNIPPQLASLRRFDLSDAIAYPKQLQRLLRALGSKSRVSIMYYSEIVQDAALAEQLTTRLKQAGHQIMSGQALAVGADAPPIDEAQLETSNYVVAIFSDRAAHSAHMAGIIEYIHKQFLVQGHPHILPIRINYDGPWPYQIGMYLNHLPYAMWHNPTDTRRLALQLCDALSYRQALTSTSKSKSDRAVTMNTPTPPAYADPKFIASLDIPNGTLSINSQFYIERAADTKLQAALEREADTTITIRAPHQSGKSSLLIRANPHMQAPRGTLVYIDLQPIDTAYLATLDRLVYYLLALIIAELKLDQHRLDQAWSAPLPPSLKLMQLFEDYIFPQSTGRIILALDEADRLIEAPYRDDFFSMLRSWHNNRARKPIWQWLDMIIIISTEPNALIHDINRSPFNVGQTIGLDDFDLAQVTELNRRYRSPLTEQQIPILFELLGGHPYLTNLALYTLVAEGVTWDELIQSATSSKGPFGDHLHYCLRVIQAEPELQQALKDIIEQGRCSEDRLFFRLTQLGLVKGVDAQSCKCRCSLYAAYFKARL